MCAPIPLPHADELARTLARMEPWALTFLAGRWGAHDLALHWDALVAAGDAPGAREALALIRDAVDERTRGADPIARRRLLVMLDADLAVGGVR